jgi:hypothetical protein
VQRSATSFANSRYFRPVRPKETSIHKWDQEFESAFLQAESQANFRFLSGLRT